MTSGALHDGREPRGPRRNRNKPRASPETKLLTGIQVRFVYERGLTGEWFSVTDALELPVTPHERYRVEAIQFRDTADLR